MLTPRQSNPQLQKYLQEKNSKIANISEASADELTLKNSMTSDSDKALIEVIREN